MQKSLDVGFVILSPEANIAHLSSTIRSIDRNYGKDVPRICIVGKKTTTSTLEEMKKVCNTLRGKNTITSLINTGIKHGHKEWNIIVMAGVIMRARIQDKYSLFIINEKDVCFPIIPDYNREGIPIRLNNTFAESSLNGVCIHQKTFNEVGDFADEESILLSRLEWAIKAKEKGCNFKAILGAKLC